MSDVGEDAAAVPVAAADQNNALATALQNVADTLALMQLAPAAPAAGHLPILHLFDDATPFDMASRAGSSAMTTASSPLSDLWDGSIDKLPAFLTSLKKRARQAKWNAIAPHGILQYTINGSVLNLLTDYHSIPMDAIDLARANRTDPRSIQNSEAMYASLSCTAEGDLQSVLFEQDGNLPDHEDGPSLFKRMIDMSIASSTQISIQALRELQDLDPAVYEYNIAAVNTKATRLFTLATTGARILSDAERTQLILSAYYRIKQPAAWATWVENKTEAFDDGTLNAVGGVSGCQRLMNAAVLKRQKLESNSDATFKWRSTSVEEDVIAMISASKTPPRGRPKRNPATGATANGDDDSKAKLPPFARHFKDAPGDNGKKYKVGDKQMFEGTTWHFCDCPQHRNRVKWHTFPAESCRSRQNWLAAQSDGGDTPTKPPPVANMTNAAAGGDDNISLSDTTALTDPSLASSAPSSAYDITAMLANAMALTANDSARDAIAEALNHLHEHL